MDINNEENLSYVAHFKTMWTKSFAGFLKTAQPGDYICFTIELLKADIYYARTIKTQNNTEQEEGDRWQQALLYKEIIQECWQQAINS